MNLDVSPAALAVDRARLLSMLSERSYAKRKVLLSSGLESDFYIDCKKTMLCAEGHWLIGKLMFAAIRSQFPEAVAVGGLTMGADPIASAISTVSFVGASPLDAFLVRKEPKGHGTGQWVEGLSLLPRGAKVIVVEDVFTTGASALKAIERSRLEGLEPIAAFGIVDRLEGGRAALEVAGVQVVSLFTRSDFP